MIPAYEIKIEAEPKESDLAVLLQGIHDHNAQHSGDKEAQILVIFARDQKHQIIGGVSGWTAFGWLRIDMLWVADSWRGQGIGAKLLSSAEAEGTRCGCRYATLDTFSFQAPEFYQKYGYTEFAVLNEIAETQTWHFLRKDLSAQIEREKSEN